MTFLPLLERELRARARSRATFWMRFGAVLVAAIICLPELLSGGFGTASNNGKFIFNGIVIIAFLLACGGCFLTADVISRERREGTLGLLLLTRVRNLDVLLGKFGSAGLTSICALAALLPMMMIPVLAGGVTGGEAFRKGLALLNTLFLALAVGLWASAGAKEMSHGIGRAVRMFAAVLVIPLVFTIFDPSPFSLLGPLSPFLMAGDRTYKHSPSNYWISLGLVHGAAWILLIAASRRLRTNTPETEEKIPTRFAGDAYYEYCRSLKRRWPRASISRTLQPVQFLTQRQRGIRATIWTAAIIALILQLGGLDAFWVLWIPFDYPMAAGQHHSCCIAGLGDEPVYDRCAAQRRTRIAGDDATRGEDNYFGPMERTETVVVGAIAYNACPPFVADFDCGLEVWPRMDAGSNDQTVGFHSIRAHKRDIRYRGFMLGGIVVWVQSAQPDGGHCLDSRDRESGTVSDLPGLARPFNFRNFSHRNIFAL